MHGVGRAGFVGQAGGACANGKEGALLFLCQLGHGQRRARVGAANQHRQAILVNPLAGLGAGHIGLILMVGGQHFNRAVQYLAAEILCRPFDHFPASRAVQVGIHAGHVGDESDLHRAGVLGRGGGGKADGQCANKCLEFHGVSWGLSCCCEAGEISWVVGPGVKRPGTPAAYSCSGPVRLGQTVSRCCRAPSHKNGRPAARQSGSSAPPARWCSPCSSA